MDSDSVEWLVKCVTMYYAVRAAAVSAWETLLELWSACVGVWSDKRYVIFEGIPGTAYNLQTVQPWATGSATPRWFVNHTRQEILKWEHQGCRTEAAALTLPFLSMEVVNGDRVHYDLTDYISGLLVKRPFGSSDTSVPTIPELIAAWSAASQIALHPTRFTIRVITEMGDTESYTMRGERIADNYEELPASDSESETDPTSKKNE